ncbi:hypothetical protein BGX33_002732 [Mortierella sp. NVP41]|nr:hypothetical protein BGX33_002732 [Mortierella sp. NVP41]
MAGLLQLIPTCIIVFSSLAVISAECGRQDRRRMFNRFSSEVVVQGESQSELEVDGSNPFRLIKPKRTFPLSILRCLGAYAQIALYAYLAFRKLEDLNHTGPGIPTTGGGRQGGQRGGRLSLLLEGRSEINEDWPLWLPVMHGIVWLYASILSTVSLLHPRLSNPYRLVTHLDLIYLTTSIAGLLHFMVNDFGRPIGLWTLDDQISGLSAAVSGCMLVLTLATKPLVPPQPMKGPDKRSRGVISPETRSSLYARIAFTWLHPMVIKSFRGKLQECDVWAMDKGLRIKTVFQEYLENRKATVFVTMLNLFRLELGQQYLWALSWVGLSMVPPYVIFKIIQFAQDLTTYNRNEALFYVAALLLSIVVRSAVLQRGLHMGQRLATKAMGMSSGLIYEKMSLRKDMDPYDYEITELVSVDVKRIGQGWKNVFNLMIYLTMVIVATFQLYGYIGHSAWAAAAAVIAWYPISALASFLFSGRFDPVAVKMERSDALVSDFLANLKAIKYLGWEEILINKVLKARAEERRSRTKTSQPVMTLISVPLGGDLIHAFAMTIVLAFYSLYFGQILTPAVLFTTLILVDIQTNAINSLPSVIISLREMLDAMVRVNDFLCDDENERDTAVIKDREMARRANIPIIGFVNASFVWPEAKPVVRTNELLFVDEPDEDHDGNHHLNNGAGPTRKKKPTGNWIVRTLSLFGYTIPQPPEVTYQQNPGRPNYGIGQNKPIPIAPGTEFALKNITLSFPPGQISLVTGTRKSGKSALLLALIGEMTRSSGKIYLPRKDYYHGKQGYGSDVAYVSQDPWLEIGGGGSISGNSTGRSTIRDTILFGTVMDEDRYSEALRACVLEDELQGLPNGDMTIIGDKNVVWSMSLKQRISLARAVYSNASHILMDDCLSFVDVKSRNFIWKNCILGPISQGKTRIVVSNQLHVRTYLNDVDYVVGLDQGIVLGHGNVREVMTQGWIRQAPGSSSIPTTIIPGATVPANLGQFPQQSLPNNNAAAAGSGPTTTPANMPPQDLRSAKSTNLPLNKMSNLGDYDDLESTLSRETAAGFRVGWSTFGTYIVSLGTFLFLGAAFMSLFLSQALFVIRIGWLGLWAENEAWDGGVPLRHTIHDRQVHRDFLSEDDPAYMSALDYIGIFIALAGVRAVFVIGNAFFLRSGAYTGADRVYTRFLRSVAMARLTVFEADAIKAVTSMAGDVGGLFAKGTITGVKDCFLRDLSGLDVKLAKEFWQFSSDVLAALLIILVIAWVQPLVLVPVSVVLFMLSSVALLGLGLSKEMHRMSIRADRMDKDQFKHTFRGLATIRGYGLERRAIKSGIAQAELYLKTMYFGSCADRWLHWKVELLSAFIPFSVAVLVLQEIEDLDPVLMGLSLYLSLQFSDKALDSLLGYGRIRNRLQWALERTRRYIHELDSPDNKEAPRTIDGKKPPAAWPHSGAVEFVNYSCSRSEAPHGNSATGTVHLKPVSRAPPLAETISKPPVGGSLNHNPQDQARHQRPGLDAVLARPNELAQSAPLDSNSTRTNTAVSAANTVASNVSQASSHLTVTPFGTVGRHAGVDLTSTSDASIATLVPLPQPSSTFMSTSTFQPPAEPPAEQPMDQLAALDQTIAPEVMESRLDAPLPPLPPGSIPPTGPASILKKSDSQNASINGAGVADGTAAAAETGFGPVTCTILPGEKVAVVGQSKSGKSTFIQSLFRIYDSAEEERIRAARISQYGHSTGNGESAASSNKSNLGSSSSFYSKSPLGRVSSLGKAKSFHGILPDLGAITVDGLDISQLGLYDLRSRFSYLSQRGTVFAGTVRFNLDPRGEHEDAELNEILRICFLSDRLKLDTELMTASTANLTPAGNPSRVVVAGTTSATRIPRYARRFFRRSRPIPALNKGKGKKDRTPATVSATSGRRLRASLEGAGSHDVTELLNDDPEQELLGHIDTSSDEDDEFDDGDTRVELDTNERQLLSLARILVQRSNVVVLDNCAAKVTDLTAQRIDQIVVQELQHATVISVGHRLDQIVARHNRILVLDHGKVVEFDTPIALLNKPDGVFRSICNPSGPNFSSLISLAKKQQTAL